MRLNFTLPLLLSLAMLSGAGSAFADNHTNRRNDKKEQRDVKRNSNNGRNNSQNRGNGNYNRPGFNQNNGNKHDKNKPNNKPDYNRPGGNHNSNSHNSAPRPGFGQPGNGNQGYGRPGPNHPAPAPNRPVPGRPGIGAPAHHPTYHPQPGNYAPVPPPPPYLGSMVRQLTRGCNDVAVWQIDPNTFIMRYRRGLRYYTQVLYPYAYRYERPTLISVNWAPMEPWTFIPSINLNINL